MSIMQVEQKKSFFEYIRLLKAFFEGYYINSAIPKEEVVLHIGALLYLKKINALAIKDINDRFKVSELVFGKTMPSNKVLCFDETLMNANAKGVFGQLLEKQVMECMKEGDRDYICEMGEFLIGWDVDERGLLNAFDFAIAMEPNGQGQNKQSVRITELAELLLDSRVKTVFDPFGGIMDFATTITDRRFVANEINITTWEVGMFRLAMVDLLEQTEFRCKDSVDWEQKQFDAIVTYPPFGVKLNLKNKSLTVADAEDVPFRYFFSTTNENGQLIAVVSTSFLSSSNSMKVGLREMVVNNNWLDTVLLIPKGAIQNGGGSSYVDQAIVVLSKNRKKGEPVRFIDTSCCMGKEGGSATIWNGNKAKELLEQPNDRYSVSVSTDDIIHNHSLWLPGYYLFRNSCKQREGFEFVRFEDVLQPIPIQRKYKETSGRMVSRLSATVLRYEMTPEDFPVSQDLGNTIKITEPVVLVSMMTASFPMYCVASKSEPIFVKYSRAFKAYRLKRDDIHVGYLCTELFRRLVSFQEYIDFYFQLSRDILDLVPLSFPMLENDGSYLEQQNLYEETREANQLAKVRELGLQKTIDELIADSKKQFRARKHSLMQNSVSLATNWEDLKDYLSTNDGRFDENDTIGVLNPVRIGEIINAISENIRIMENKIYHLTDEDIDWGETEEIVLQDFIVDYIAGHQTARYRFEFEPKENVNMEGYDQNGLVNYIEKPDWKVLMPRKALQQVFDNIVSNARDHGFVDGDKSNYVIRFDYFYTLSPRSIVLEISNNGKALAEGVDTEFITTYGSSTKLNDKNRDDESVHEGQGGSEIEGILKQYNAKVEVESDPDAVFAVTYRIVFNDVKDTIVGVEVPDWD